MTFLCSISGVQPSDPCLSKTGYVFERRLIEKHLEESSVCPVTGEPLTTQDLISIKSDVISKPRLVTASSIPGLLSLLQSEWDALALETHNMRSHVDEVRKQLSYSLYQHDAATRVIARVLKQRDSALEEVESLKQQLLQFRANYDVNSLETGFDEGAIERIQELAKALLTERKKRDLSGYLTSDKLAKFSLKGEFRLHSSTVPGVLCVALDKSKNSKTLEDSFCFTGGSDGSVVYFDLGNSKKLVSLNGHMKKVNCLTTHPYENVVLSGSDDSTVRVWREFEDEFKCTYVLKHHKSGVRTVSLHPSGEYVVSLSNDGVWGLCEVDTGKVVKMHRDVQKCNSLKFHPDGLICVGASTNSSLQVWDIREAKLKDPLTHKTQNGLDNTSSNSNQGDKERKNIKDNKNTINSVVGNGVGANGTNHSNTTNGTNSSSGDNLLDFDFSENGYYLASVSEGGELLLWDLRKQSVVSSTHCNVNPSRVKFDKSGKFLGVSSTKVEVFNLKDKTNLVNVTTLEGHSGNVTDLEFGPNSNYLLSTCMDKSLRLFH